MFRPYLLDLPAGALGLHFFGTVSTQFPLGDGFRCVAGPLLQEVRLLQADVDGVATQALELTLPPAVWYFVPGATLQFQFAYRDAAGGPAGFNFSDALEITFQ